MDVADAKVAAQGILDDHLEWGNFKDLIVNDRFTTGGVIGVGVPLGTPDFAAAFIKSKCQEIIEDVDLLDDIEHGFVHYQLCPIWAAVTSVPNLIVCTRKEVRGAKPVQRLLALLDRDRASGRPSQLMRSCL